MKGNLALFDVADGRARRKGVTRRVAGHEFGRQARDVGLYALQLATIQARAPAAAANP